MPPEDGELFTDHPPDTYLYLFDAILRKVSAHGGTVKSLFSDDFMLFLRGKKRNLLTLLRFDEI